MAWKVVVFPDDEVAAVPVSWLILIFGKLMCFWPEKNARLKRAKDENPPASGNDKYKLFECRVLMNDEEFSTFKEALAMEIKAQDTSYKDGHKSDSSSINNQKFSVEDEEFEFIKEAKGPKEIPVIDDDKIDETSKAFDEEVVPKKHASVLLEIPEIDDDEVNETSKALDDKVVPTKHASVLLEDNETNNLENHTLEKNEVSDQIDVRKRSLDVTEPNRSCDAAQQVQVQLSDSEKINKILLNQEAEQKIFAELIKRMDGVEKHIKKYGGGPFSKVIEGLTLQVTSKDMFSKLEMDLLEYATKNALADHFHKTIFEKEVKQFVKILLMKFFEEKFYAHHVTGKSGGTVVLIRSETLSCIYDCIEKKFGKKRREVEDSVFKAIDQLKDSLRKKFPKLLADRKRKLGRKDESETVEDKDEKREATKKRKRDRIRERLEKEERERERDCEKNETQAKVQIQGQ